MKLTIGLPRNRRAAPREGVLFCSFCASMLAEDGRVCAQCGAPWSLAASPRWPREVVPAYREARRAVPDAASWRQALDPPRGVWRQPAPPGVRSFRFNAVIAFILYFPFFLPGLIASAVWWNQARTIENRTGMRPPGKGCLSALLLYGVLVSLLWVMVFGFV